MKNNNKAYQDLITLLSKYDFDSDKTTKLSTYIKDLKKSDVKHINYVSKYIAKKDEWTSEDLYLYIKDMIDYDKAKRVFSKNFQHYAKLRGKSVTDISNDLIISYSTVNDWFNGKSYPRAGRIEALAKYLNINTSDLTEEKTATKVPVLGKIPAGIPNEAIEYIEDWEEIPTSWTNSDKDYFALKINGTSMTPTYQDGDVVIFERTSECPSR